MYKRIFNSVKSIKKKIRIFNVDNFIIPASSKFVNCFYTCFYTTGLIMELKVLIKLKIRLFLDGLESIFLLEFFLGFSSFITIIN